MRLLNDFEFELEKINLNIQNLEKLIKLLLVNNLIDDFSFIENQDKLQINEEIVSELHKNNLEIGKQVKIEDSMIIYIFVSNSIEFKNILILRNMFIKFHPNIELVFQFEKINGMKRKRMMQEKISYHVIDRELHIFSLN